MEKIISPLLELAQASGLQNIVNIAPNLAYQQILPLPEQNAQNFNELVQEELKQQIIEQNDVEMIDESINQDDISQQSDEQLLQQNPEQNISENEIQNINQEINNELINLQENIPESIVDDQEQQNYLNFVIQYYNNIQQIIPNDQQLSLLKQLSQFGYAYYQLYKENNYFEQNKFIYDETRQQSYNDQFLEYNQQLQIPKQCKNTVYYDDYTKQFKSVIICNQFHEQQRIYRQ